MNCDQEVVIGKLRLWEGYLKEHTLPTWDELPGIDLYMDQVISLLSEYLTFLPREEGSDAVVTAAAINNYVRKKVMPAPLKKRYKRIHLAYLIIICTLKQCVGISYIQRLIPMDLTEEEMMAAYDEFVEFHRKSCLYFIDQIHAVAREMIPRDRTSGTGVRSLVTTSAVVSGLTRMMTEKLLMLEDQPEPEENK